MVKQLSEQTIQNSHNNSQSSSNSLPNQLYKIDVKEFPQLRQVIKALPQYSSKPRKRRHSIRKQKTQKLQKLLQLKQLHLLNPGALINKFPPFQFGNRRRCAQVKITKDPRVYGLPKVYIKSQRVLDIGCGEGNLTLQVAIKYGPQYILGIDLSKSLIRYALKCKEKVISSINKLNSNAGYQIKDESLSNLHYSQSNFFVAPIKQGEYDTIMCFNTIEYISATFEEQIVDLFLKRMHYGLCQDGALILSFKEKGKPQIKQQQGDSSSSKGCSAQYMESKLKSIGFSIQRNRYNTQSREMFIVALKKSGIKSKF